MAVHKSVLLKEAVAALNLKSGLIAVDVTLGAGGHSAEIVQKVLPNGKLIAFDQDKKAIEEFEKQIGKQKIGTAENLNKNIFLLNKNFSDLKDGLFSLDVFQVDAILADLGISSDQLGDPERGLSLMFEGPLDMRLDQGTRLKAWDIVNKWSEDEIADVLFGYGDEKFARKIARKIVESRSEKNIETTKELVKVITEAVPKKYQFGKTHFATKTFQALRIAVNDELENLKKFLSQGVEVLNPRGRIAIISFHSGEDRIVKDFFRKLAMGCECPADLPQCVCGKKPILKIITKKPIIPSEVEIAENPRSRSAKLRIAEKI